MKNKILNKSVSLLLCFITIILMVCPFSVSAVDVNDKDWANSYKVIVSLGDSFSSGEGIEPFYGQEDHVSAKVLNPDWLAHRSKKSWPGRLTLKSPEGRIAMSSYRNKYWFFTAVSGAVTSDLNGKQYKYYNKNWGLNKGSKYLDPQLEIFDNMGGKKANYVTMTMGGNDAHFTDIITSAVTSSSYLTPNKMHNEIEKVWTEFYETGGIKDKLYQAYKDVESKAGKQANIIIAGYPRLLDENGKGLPFSKNEALVINTAVSSFNQEIKKIVNSCRAQGMKIHFVSVEEKFNGHGAYSNEPFLNKVYILETKSEDLVDLGRFSIDENGKKSMAVSSAYSIHPNDAGAAAYASCVQAKLDELEEAASKPERKTSDERDIVLVLDVSGSMEGTPLDETKKASEKFIDTILKADASIGLVTYDHNATMLSDFNMDKAHLTQTVKSIGIGGNTNIEAGLSTAHDMLKTSNAKKKIIVLMSDGAPNEGKTGEDLINYADSIKDENIYIYTLGFFANTGGAQSDAQSLMEQIASDGCHYEVANADDLVFFFGDIADQLNGQKYIYVRIACPVDVTVTHDGESLCSVADDLSTRTDFGTLTFEYNENSNNTGTDNRIKILRLKEGEKYDIQIEGNGRGYMNYTIGFMDSNGEYSDLRKFQKVKISKRTVIDTVASKSNSTVLKVDEDGDGKYDIKYKAGKNSRAKVVNNSYIIYIALATVVLITAVVIVKKKKKS